MVDANQIPVGYSETNTSESFPLVVPPGVSLEPFSQPSNSDPVVIWSDLSPSPTALIEIQGDASNVSTTVIKRLFLVGADRGIWVHSDLGHAVNVNLQGVNFAWNKDALLVEAANDTDIVLETSHCRIRDDQISPTGYAPPLEQFQERGFVFHSVSDAQQAPGSIAADVIDFRSLGTFATMNPIAMPGTAFNDATRLIEVVAQGHNKQFDNPAVPIEPGNKISSVTLNISGGDLFGAAKDTGGTAGWDIGIFGLAKKPGGTTWSPDNYYASVEISLNGTMVKDMRQRGIYFVTQLITRSTLALDNGSTVQDIGSQNALQPGSASAINHGIEITSFDESFGYFQFSADGNNSIVRNTIRRCRGNGVSVNHFQSGNDSYGFLPTGLRVATNNLSLYENDRNGISFDVGRGIVGGTWQSVPSIPKRSLLQIIPGLSMGFGPGFMNQITSSNNGDYGIYFSSHSSSPSNSSITCIQITNSFIWNNAKGGIFGDISLGAEFFVPIAHCTIAGNGGVNAVFRNLEIGDQQDTLALQWIEQDANLPITREIGTKLYNCILERKGASENDLGSSAFSRLTLDDANPATPHDPNSIYYDGIRIKRANQLAGSYQTPLPSPFSGLATGGVTWSNNSPDDLQLDTNSPNWNALFDTGPSYLPTAQAMNLLLEDFFGTTRPTLALRDKGAHNAN